jgi:UDPglucose 6-dehydrogenase
LTGRRLTRRARPNLTTMEINGSGAPNVVIVGTGYVGLTTGAALAHLGANVVCCDVDARKIEMLDNGEIPIFEEGLAELIAPSRQAGRLRFELGVEKSVGDADIIFLCVPTPQDDDGSADLTYVRAAARQISPLLKPGAIVVNKSTVPVGSVGVVGEALGRDDVAVVSNPEFLREGSAVHDCLHPDRVVIGAHDRVAAQKVADLYAGIDTTFVFTDPTSAELIKYAANGFLAM